MTRTLPPAHGYGGQVVESVKAPLEPRTFTELRDAEARMIAEAHGDVYRRG